MCAPHGKNTTKYFSSIAPLHTRLYVCSTQLLANYKGVEVTGNGCMSQSIVLTVGKNCTTVEQARKTLSLL